MTAPPTQGPPSRYGRFLIPALAATLLAVAPLPASAQSGNTTGKNAVEVLADNAIEWNREQRQYIAQGNAVAIQGNTRVYGDKLIAAYRETPEGSGSTDIYRMEAIGSVRIVLPDQTITGSRAVREIDRGLIWIVGNPPTLTTKTDIVTATERMEYWEKTHKALAIGGATARAINSQRTISADVLEADFSKEGAPDQRGSGVRIITATGNVKIVTENETITGDDGTYVPQTGKAVLLGNVHLQSADGRQLAGSRAEVNMKSGISRLYSSDGHTNGGGQVRAIFDLDKKPGTGTQK